MALVEIEAGPHRITAAITRDAVEELGLAEGAARDRGRQGHVRDGRAHARLMDERWQPESWFVATARWS